MEASCRNLLANCLVSEERIAPLGACSVGFAGLGGPQAQKTGVLNEVIVIVTQVIIGALTKGAGKLYIFKVWVCLWCFLCMVQLINCLLG